MEDVLRPFAEVLQKGARFAGRRFHSHKLHRPAREVIVLYVNQQ
jgi:hypothetical protein